MPYIVVVSTYIPTSYVEGFPFLHTLSITWCLWLDYSHSDWGEVISHCSSDLHFSNNEWHWSPLHVFIMYVFFGHKCLFRSFAHFLIGLFFLFVFFFFFSFFWYWVNISCLYILEINYLSVVSFAIIFSHSEGCPFTLFIVSFAVKKLLSLLRSYLFIYFCFNFHYSRRWVIKDFAMIYVTVFCYATKRIKYLGINLPK